MTSNATGRIDALDALRGVAALMIFTFHYFALFPQGRVAECAALNRIVLDYFAMAVPLFYALSGLSLYIGYFSKRSAAGFRSEFYVRRLFRIAPLFYFAIVAWALVYISREAQLPWDRIAASASFLFNLLPGYHESFVAAGWSVGVEMLFYLAFPFIVLRVVSVATAVVSWAIASLITVAALPMLGYLLPKSSYPGLSLLSNGHYFAGGIAVFFLAEFWRARVQQGARGKWIPLVVLGFAGVALATVAVPQISAAIFQGHPGVHVAAWSLPIAALLFAADTLAIRGRWLRQMARLGEWSFSLYLLHPLVLYVIFEPLRSHGGVGSVGVVRFFGFYLLALVALITAAAVTFRWIERPGMSMGRELARGGAPAARQKLSALVNWLKLRRVPAIVRSPALRESNDLGAASTPCSDPIVRGAPPSSGECAENCSPPLSPNWQGLHPAWFMGLARNPLGLTISIALVVCASLHVINITRGWTHTLLDAHAFRQCQTALTTFLFKAEGLKLAYETPVFGPPWSIPMEAPWYQMIVAELSSFSGFPLEQTGRAVTAFFFYASIWPLLSVLGSLKVNRLGRALSVLFVLSSPLYVFWSRTFLIESTALFLSLAYAALFLRFLKRGSGRLYYLAVVLVGCLAATAKVTSFAVCFGFTVLVALAWLFERPRTQSSGKLRKLVLVVVAWGIPIAIGGCWTLYGDHLKAQNPSPMAHVLLSGNMEAFNFGTLETRLIAGYWKSLYTFGVGNVTAHGWPCVIALLGILLFPRSRLPTILLLGAFCSGPLVFANLYAVHDYYWYANSVFLLAAIAVPISEAATMPHLSRAGLAVLALAVSLTGWIGYYRSDYYRLQNVEETYDRDLGGVIRGRTRAKDVIMVFGANWSSSIPYYSERRAIMPWARGFEKAPGTAASVSMLKDEGRNLALLVVTGADRKDPSFVRDVVTRFGFRASPFFDDQRTLMFLAKETVEPPPSVGFLDLSVLSVTSNQPILEIKEGDLRVWRLHAPSKVLATVPGNARGLTISYGLARLAYTDGGMTSGATFRISLVHSDGRKEVLLDRTLQPKTIDKDRGVQEARLGFEASTGTTLVLETDMYGSSAWDWTFWSKARFD